MNTQPDDDIDALLRKSFGDPVPDEGFVDRVMQQLPPRRVRSAWPLAVGVLVGAVLCVLSVFSSSLWHEAWQEWRIGAWSTATLVVLSTMAAMSLLALSWTLSEAEDR